MTWIRRSHTSNEFRRQRARGATRVNDALPSCDVGKISDLCPSEDRGPEYRPMYRSYESALTRKLISR